MILFNILSTSQSGSILIKIFQTKPKRPLDQQLPRHDLLGNTQHCTIRRVHPGQGYRLETTNIQKPFQLHFEHMWNDVKLTFIEGHLSRFLGRSLGLVSHTSDPTFMVCKSGLDTYATYHTDITPNGFYSNSLRNVPNFRWYVPLSSN